MDCPDVDVRLVCIDSILSLKRELHGVVFDRDFSFPIVPFLMNRIFFPNTSLRGKEKDKSVLLPAVLAVHIIQFLYTRAESRGQAYVRADGLYARAMHLGELIGAAEHRLYSLAIKANTQSQTS
jgi:hypothetical protein